ncbi:MAG: hypothetical protein ACPGXZ_13820 [Saprospiraceae bacterium]
MKKIFLLFLTVTTIFACDNGGEALQEINLLPFGMPITVKAPADTLITAGTMGDMQEVVINSKDSSSVYSVQIYSVGASLIDVGAIVNEEKALVESDSSFTKYIMEDPKGFVYEYKYSDTDIGYDFRYFRIQGDKKYTFRTSFGPFHTEEAAKMMFEAVKN